LGASAFAAVPVIPGNPVPAIERLMSAVPRNAAAFRPQSDGSVLHIQSGFVCPAALPNVNLWNLTAYPTPQPGADIGCDYGRVPRGQTGPAAESKFSIFLTRRPGATLDEAFQHYRDEMHGNYPNSRIKGDLAGLNSVDVDKNGRKTTLPPVKSEVDEFTLANRPYINELIVTIAGGWIVEIRATYPTGFVAGDPATGIDIPASGFVWATSVRDFAVAKVTTK
jgi:hypothetical protein